MSTLSLLCRSSVLVLLAVSSASQAQDLHLKKNISAGGYVVSTTETSIKGARERSVTQSPNGSTETLRQCDLRRCLANCAAKGHEPTHRLQRADKVKGRCDGSVSVVHHRAVDAGCAELACRKSEVGWRGCLDSPAATSGHNCVDFGQPEAVSSFLGGSRVLRSAARVIE